ncbi:MAG: transaldolase family protein [Streptosporangiaceae bacterium]
MRRPAGWTAGCRSRSTRGSPTTPTAPSPRPGRAIAAERWKSLERAGARPQRPLWASTSVKDPAYDDTRYVTGLVAPGVINTMPEATLNAVTGHGEIPDDSIHGTYGPSAARSMSSTSVRLRPSGDASSGARSCSVSMGLFYITISSRN